MTVNRHLFDSRVNGREQERRECQREESHVESDPYAFRENTRTLFISPCGPFMVTSTVSVRPSGASVHLSVRVIVASSLRA